MFSDVPLLPCHTSIGRKTCSDFVSGRRGTSSILILRYTVCIFQFPKMCMDKDKLQVMTFFTRKTLHRQNTLCNFLPNVLTVTVFDALLSCIRYHLH